MRIGNWLRKPGKSAVLIVAAAAGGGAALAVASVPDSTGAIHACVEELNGTPITNAGNIRIIDPNANPAQTCLTAPAGGAGEVPISWNTVGLRGATGATGVTGAQGVAGHTITIAGETFSLSNGRTATVTRQPAIAPLQVNPKGAPIATLTIGTGAGAITTNVLGYSFTGPGAAQSTSAGSGRGKVKFDEFSITKTVDKSSPQLFKACVSGQHFKTAVLHVRKQGSDQPITYDLTGVVVATYQTASGGDRPTESLSLNFTKIEVKSTTQEGQ
jgi:type VI protein secretion system component Hcp